MEKQQQQGGGGVVAMPEWVMAMITAEFSIIKEKRIQKEEDDLMYFCVDCSGQSLTEAERKAKHKGHKVLRAYTCSHSYGYDIVDIYGLRGRGLDVSGVAAYKINTRRLFYPKSPRAFEKYQNKHGVHGLCFTCGRMLKPAGIFCSILCKFLSCPPLNHHATDAIRISMSFLVQNQVVRMIGLVSRKGSSKKKQLNNKEKKKEMINKTGSANYTEENQAFAGSISDRNKQEKNKNKRRRIDNNEGFGEENQVLGDSNSDYKKTTKVVNNKDGGIKAKSRGPLLVTLKLGATASASASACANDGDDGMNKTETNHNDGEKLLNTTDTEKLNQRKRRRKGIPRRSPSN